jgi:hypothetical protein
MGTISAFAFRHRETKKFHSNTYLEGKRADVNISDKSQFAIL